MSKLPPNTYWNHKGKYQAACALLHAMIPIQGEVAEPKKNKALEKFRRAVNCYYDLYNNGLCNRMSEFRGIIGFAAGPYRLTGRYGRFDRTLYEKLEERMDEIILAAAAEQGIDPAKAAEDAALAAEAKAAEERVAARAALEICMANC